MNFFFIMKKILSTFTKLKKLLTHFSKWMGTRGAWSELKMATRLWNNWFIFLKVGQRLKMSTPNDFTTGTKRSRGKQSRSVTSFHKKFFAVRNFWWFSPALELEITTEAEINRQMHKAAQERLRNDIEALKTWRKEHYPKVRQTRELFLITVDVP